MSESNEKFLKKILAESENDRRILHGKLDDMKKRLAYAENNRALMRKKYMQTPAAEDSFVWSIADLMTLLLIFFILFYTHAANNKDVNPKEKSNKVTYSSIRLAPVTYMIKDEPGRAGMSNEEKLKEHDHDSEATLDDSLAELRAELQNTLNESGHDDLAIKWNQRRLVIILGESITFDAGKAELLDNSKPTLKRLAEIISGKQGFRVVVSGHTDDTPINTRQFPSNWELSAARAVKVARFIIDNGIPAGQVSITGYSEYSPIFENSSPENKQANRRVEISLIKEKNIT